jgi:hypothetical protein
LRAHLFTDPQAAMVVAVLRKVFVLLPDGNELALCIPEGFLTALVSTVPV